MATVCYPRDDTWKAVCDNATVPQDRNYLRQWREKAELSQEELAEKVGTTKSVISLLENEKRPLSSNWLRKLATALKTTPGRILDIDPADGDADVLKLFDDIPKKDRPTALRVLRSLTGTHD